MLIDANGEPVMDILARKLLLFCNDRLLRTLSTTSRGLGVAVTVRRMFDESESLPRKMRRSFRSTSMSSYGLHGSAEISELHGHWQEV